MEKKRVLIVGYGLAGGFLAAELALRGHKVVVADDHEGRSASLTAAGLYNIITGRYAATTWQAGTLLEHLHRFFQHEEVGFFLRPYLHETQIYRPFLNVQESNDWQRKSEEEPLSQWVRLVPPRKEDVLVNPLGGIEILPCGWLDVPPFLGTLAQVLASKCQVDFLRRHLNPEQINPETGAVEGLGEFDAIVSAQGLRALQTPWWKALPLKALKGQVLELSIPGLELEHALSRGVFLIPKGGGQYTCGSTYEHQFHDEAPTPEGIARITTSLAQTVRLPAQVLDARAALRPTTPDRRPILGRHPLFPRLWVVNGMGTKGVLQAPWSAAVLTDALEGRVKNLPPEVEVARFGLDFS